MSSLQHYLVAIDTGGTFTDVVLWSGSRLHTFKLLSTPDDPARAVLHGLGAVLKLARGESVPLQGCLADSLEAVTQVIHGSTVATNCLLELDGARVAFVTNSGLADLLHIGRQNRPKLYALRVEKPHNLVDRERCFGIEAQMSPDGTELAQPDPAVLQRLGERIAEADVDAIAICLLHAYANPSHERMVSRALNERLPETPISLSSEILPEFREVERASTTVVNAYVTPKMQRYLGRLEQKIGSEKLRVMQSNGGVIAAQSAREQPVHTVLSGPAGGVVGALYMARMSGMKRILTFDMGGTSTDVALCQGGPTITSESAVGAHALRIPIIDIHTVGAGGGSIASLDAGGALQVGPKSAGADPGPACYGTGELPTVTDANLICGRLLSDRFLGGRMPLDPSRAERALDRLAEQCGLDRLALAEGILDVANTAMSRALKLISVERGVDPREFALVTFGGAGGMHACALAEALQVSRILVPAHAGLLSALGMLAADVERRYSRTVLAELTGIAAGEIDAGFGQLEQQALADMRNEGFEADRLQLIREVDLRYRGQSFELTLPFGESLPEAFETLHQQRYGYAHQQPIELVTLRLRAVGRVDKPRLPPVPGTGRQVTTRAHKMRFGGEWLEAAYCERSELPVGGRVEGPAVIGDACSTTVVFPGWVALRDRYGNLLINRRPVRR